MSEAAIEPVEGEPVELAEEVWSGPTQEEWQQTQTQLQEAAALVEAVRQGNQSDGPLADYDPEFRQQLDQWFDQKVAPYQSFQQEAILGEAEQRAQDILHDLSVRDGEFDTQTARLRADHLLPEFAAKYGPGPKAAEAALAAAASAQRDYETALRTAAVEQYQNGMRGLPRTPVEPAANGVIGAQQHVTPEGGDERDLVRAYFPSAR